MARTTARTSEEASMAQAAAASMVLALGEEQRNQLLTTALKELMAPAGYDSRARPRSLLDKAFQDAVQEAAREEALRLLRTDEKFRRELTLAVSDVQRRALRENGWQSKLRDLLVLALLEEHVDLCGD